MDCLRPELFCSRVFIRMGSGFLPITKVLRGNNSWKIRGPALFFSGKNWKDRCVSPDWLKNLAGRIVIFTSNQDLPAAGSVPGHLRKAKSLKAVIGWFSVQVIMKRNLSGSIFPGPLIGVDTWSGPSPLSSGKADQAGCTTGSYILCRKMVIGLLRGWHHKSLAVDGWRLTVGGWPLAVDGSQMTVEFNTPILPYSHTSTLPHFHTFLRFFLLCYHNLLFIPGSALSKRSLEYFTFFCLFVPFTHVILLRVQISVKIKSSG